MTEAVERLGRRAAISGFLPEGDRFLSVPDDGKETQRDDRGALFRWYGDVWVPNVDDAATRGVLLALVRTRWPDGEFIRITPISGDQWIAHGARDLDGEGRLWLQGDTETEAVVLAWESSAQALLGERTCDGD